MSEIEPLLTKHDVAKILGCSPNSVRNYKKKGLRAHPALPNRYRREDVIAFVNLGTEETKRECHENDERSESSHGPSSNEGQASGSGGKSKASNTVKSFKASESTTLTGLMRRIDKDGRQSKERQKARADAGS